MEDRYYLNVMTLTVIWSATSFNNYLLNFMNKYLEGNIFQNSYCDGLAGITSALVGAQIYKNYGKRKAFAFSFGIALASGVVIYLLQT